MDRAQSLDVLERELDRALLRAREIGGLPEVEDWLLQARERVVLVSAEPARPSVAVIGASADRSKFGNKAVRAFVKQGFDVYPVNPNAERIEGLRSYPSLDAVPVDRLDWITLYVPAAVGLAVLDQAARKQVGEVWLNPGADAPEVVARAEALGLNVIQACSILAVGEHPSRF